ncbi:hypothetical protein LINPERHAP1_LOCUS7098 [Linum perenne]
MRVGLPLTLIVHSMLRTGERLQVASYGIGRRIWALAQL